MEISENQLKQILDYFNKYLSALEGYYIPEDEKEVKNFIYQLEQSLDSEH